jgi:hypothetical protein
MGRFPNNPRFRIGILVGVACLAAVNLWRTRASADDGDSRVVVMENVYLRNNWSYGLRELVVAEGSIDCDWVAATARFHDIRVLTVENRDVRQEEVGRFLYLHPEVRHVEIELVRISRKCAERLIDCPDLKSVRLGEKNRDDDAAVLKLKKERPDVHVWGYYGPRIITCFGPDEKGCSPPLARAAATTP